MEYEAELCRDHDTVDLWDLSYAKIIYDPEHMIQAFINQKLSKQNRLLDLCGMFIGTINWPANARENILDILCKKVEEFKKLPSYKTKEVLLSLISEPDLYQYVSYGMVRVTEYEVGILNYLYLWCSISDKFFESDFIVNAFQFYLDNSKVEEYLINYNLYVDFNVPLYL